MIRYSWEILYLFVKDMKIFLYVSLTKFSLARLVNISMNSKSSGKIKRRKTCFYLGKREEIGRSSRASRFEEACILIRVPTSICQGLAINAGVSNCLFRNPLCVNKWRYGILFLAKGISTAFSTAVTSTEAISRASVFFCQSLLLKDKRLPVL